MDETRLLELLDARLDGSLEPVGREEMEAALLGSPRLRRCYWEYLQQHSLTRELLMEGLGRGLAFGGRPRRRRRTWLLAAAGTAAAVVIAAGLYFALLPERQEPTAAGRVAAESVFYGAEQSFEYGEILRTIWEEPVEVQLADQSVLTIAPESRVSVPERRRVELESGAVRVKVRPDEKKPFVVSAGGTTVRALGTEFVVLSRDRTEEGQSVSKRLVNVVVISGAVLLANQWGELRLDAGQAAASEAGAKPAKSGIAEKVKKLIALLSHKDFAVREKASKELAELADGHGEIVIPLCEAALKTAKDPEVRERLKAFKDPGAHRGPREILAKGPDDKPFKFGRPAVGSGIKAGIDCQGVVSLGVNKTNVPGPARGRHGLLDFLDVDGDRKPEILAYFASSIDKSTTIYACKPDGSAAKGFPLKLKGAVAPRVVDINGDGKPEIVRLMGNQIEVLDLAGKPVKGFPVNSGGGTFKSIDVADITGNGRMEIIVSRWMQREIKAWDAKGKALKGFPVKFPKWRDNVMYTMALAKVDKGSSRRHILTMHGGGGLVLINGFGRFARGWPVSVEKAGKLFYGGGKMGADLDGDGVDEIFAQVCSKAGSRDYELLVLDRSGKPREGFPIPYSVVPVRKNMLGGRYAVTGPVVSLGDVDGDGKKEITWVDPAAYLHAVKADGSSLEGYPQPVRHGNKQHVITQPMLWDLNGDKTKEIIYLVHGADGDGYTLRVYDKAGNDIAKDLGLKLTIAGVAIEDARIADLDGDGKPEIVCYTKPGKFNRATMWNRKVMAFSLKANGKK